MNNGTISKCLLVLFLNAEIVKIIAAEKIGTTFSSVGIVEKVKRKGIMVLWCCRSSVNDSAGVILELIKSVNSGTKLNSLYKISNPNYKIKT